MTSELGWGELTKEQRNVRREDGGGRMEEEGVAGVILSLHGEENRVFFSDAEG